MVVPGQTRGGLINLMLITASAILASEFSKLLDYQKGWIFDVSVNYCEEPFLHRTLPGNGFFEHKRQVTEAIAIGGENRGLADPDDSGHVPPAGDTSSEQGHGSNDDTDSSSSYRYGSEPEDQFGFESSTNNQNAIYNGDNVDYEPNGANQFPFVVSIAEERFPYRVLNPLKIDFDPNQVSEENPIKWPFTQCTGMILTDRLILTASHCMTSPFNKVIVTAGVKCRPELGGILAQWDQAAGTTQIRRSRKIESLTPDDLGTSKVQPWTIFKYSYNPFLSPHADLALIEVEEPFDLSPESGISAVPLVDESECQDEWSHAWPLAGATRRLSSSGWGQIYSWYVTGVGGVRQEERRNPTQLQWFDLEYATLTEEMLASVDIYSTWVDRCNGTKQPTNGWICLPVTPGVDPQTCRGDSGGPLFKREREGQDKTVELIGVLSGGYLLNQNVQEAGHLIGICGNSELIIWTRLCGQPLNWINHKIQNVHL